MNRVIHSLKSGILEILRFLLWILRYRKSSKTEPGSNRGEKVVIMGNGPSVKDFPVEKYREKGYSFCCVNFFAIDEERFFSLKPRFYCCIDPAFADPEIQKTEECKALISALERVDWDMKFICYRGEHMVLRNPHIKISYITRNVYTGPMNRFKTKLYAKNMASCGFQNVMVGVAYYFIMTKAEHVLMTGVENNWHLELFVGEDCDVYRRATHFYGTEVINLVKDGSIGKGQLYLYFEWYALTLRQYEAMAKFAQANGVRVENTCLDGFIDAFPKVKA